jgi:glycosyltransferase involved in cell wall biosynthesis
MSGSPRKPLLVINALHHGGAEYQLIYLAAGLAESGHEVTLCCIDRVTIEVEPLERTGVEIVCLHAGTRWKRAAALWRLFRLARRADVVQCTMWDASFWGRLAAILARRPVVVADHAADRSIQIAASGAPRGRWIALHNRLLDRFTYATVACATPQRQVLLSEGVAAEKIVHIPNGLPISEIAAEAAGGPSREELGLPADAPVAIQVGVFRKEKNQIAALEALAGARQQVPGVHLVFVGGGAEQERVEERARELDGGWTHFLGFREDVPELISLADLLIQPSTADAMPMTVLEAMALGVPVVATAVGDVAWMVGEEAGICAPLGDEAALERACVEILSDDDRRAAMGAAAVKRATEFDASLMVRHYERLFRAALDGEPPTAALAEGEPSGASPVATQMTGR